MRIHTYRVLFTLLISIPSTYGWLPPLTVHEEELFRPLRTEVTFNTTPAGFGSTHFIVGHTNQPVTQQNPTSPDKKEVFKLTPDNRICSVLFAPDQKICKKLIALIDRENEYICVAAYMITDKRIAAALCKAQKRGVRVEVVVDPGCLQDRSNKIAMLYEAGISVYVYTPPSKGIIRSLMHDKFVLFGNTIYHRPLIWTGSANFTCKADEINQENIVILDDKEIFKRFLNQFTILKKRSEQYAKSHVTNAELHERMYKKSEL